jgi:hypothetical protein
VVQQTVEFKAIATRQWRVDQAARMTVEEILEHYRCDINPRESIKVLPLRLQGTHYCCVIEVSNCDRTGLETLPPHVMGRCATFFVDADTYSIKHVIVGVYSTW